MLLNKTRKEDAKPAPSTSPSEGEEGGEAGEGVRWIIFCLRGAGCAKNRPEESKKVRCGTF